MMNVFAQVVYLAAEEAPEGIDLVIPEINELIGGVIAFGIVFAFVWFWGRPAIARTLQARQDAITGQLKEAEEAKAEAEGLLEDYRKQLAEARSEANRIVEESRQQADAVKADMIARAQSEADDITAKAREDAAAEKERAAASIRGEVAALSVELAQKAVSESVDADAQRALVDRYIDELGSMS